MGKEYSSKSSMKDYKSTIFFFLWAVTSTILLVYKNRLPSSDVLFDKNDRRAVNAIEKKVVSFRESTLQGINDTSARYAAQKWHGGSPTDLFKGSCYCGDEDKYCMCTPSLAIDAIIEIHHSSEKTATIRNRGLRIEDQEEDHGEDLLPSGRRNLESEETTGDLEGDEDERYQNNNKKDHKRRNRNHKQKQGRKREAEDSGFDNRRMLDEEEGEEQEYKFHGKYGNDNKKDHNRRNHNNKQKKALKRPSGGLESEYMESPRRLQEDEASENDEFVEKHHNNNEKDHKRRNHNHKQKNARKKALKSNQDYEENIMSEETEVKRRLDEDNDEFVEKHHNNNEKDHKRRNHNHKQKDARKKALNQNYEAMEVGTEVTRRLEEVNDESNRYLKSDGEKIMADKISTVGGEANSLKNISLVLVLRRDPPANTYAIPGGFVTVGETLEETVTREVKEETNLDLFTIEQFKMYSDPNRDKRRHTVSAVFRCIAIDSKALKKGDDAKNVALVPLRDVLKMPLAFDHKVVLTEYIKKYHNYILT